MQDQWKEEKVKLMLAKCLGKRFAPGWWNYD